MGFAVWREGLAGLALRGRFRECWNEPEDTGGAWGEGVEDGDGFGRRFVGPEVVQDLAEEFVEFGAQEAGVAVGAAAFAESGDVAGAGVEADVGVGEDLVLGGVLGAAGDEVGAGFGVVGDEEGLFETLGSLDVPEFGGELVDEVAVDFGDEVVVVEALLELVEVFLGFPGEDPAFGVEAVFEGVLGGPGFALGGDGSVREGAVGAGGVGFD